MRRKSRLVGPVGDSLSTSVIVNATFPPGAGGAAPVGCAANAPRVKRTASEASVAPAIIGLIVEPPGRAACRGGR
jgi:hypothetical protein